MKVFTTNQDKSVFVIHFRFPNKMDKSVLEHKVEYLVVQTYCDPFTRW